MSFSYDKTLRNHKFHGFPVVGFFVYLVAIDCSMMFDGVVYSSVLDLPFVNILVVKPDLYL